MSEHTPTPWAASDVRVDATARKAHEGPTCIASSVANAAHIVKCVNLHDELVAAMEGLLASIDTAADYLTDLCYSNVCSAEVKQARALLEKINQS